MNWIFSMRWCYSIVKENTKKTKKKNYMILRINHVIGWRSSHTKSQWWLRLVGCLIPRSMDRPGPSKLSLITMLLHSNARCARHRNFFQLYKQQNMNHSLPLFNIIIATKLSKMVLVHSNQNSKWEIGKIRYRKKTWRQEIMDYVTTRVFFFFFQF